LKHKRPGTELKLINGRYYLYSVKSVYDKTLKNSRKVSLGIFGEYQPRERIHSIGKGGAEKRKAGTPISISK